MLLRTFDKDFELHSKRPFKDLQEAFKALDTATPYSISRVWCVPEQAGLFLIDTWQMGPYEALRIFMKQCEVPLDIIGSYELRGPGAL